MTAIATTAPVPAVPPAPTAPLWRAGVAAGLAAAAAATVVAAAALAAGVPVEIEGEQIPLAAFAQLTLLCVALGAGIAKALSRWAAAPRRTFTLTAVALTVLSLVPDLAVGATTATRVALVATHLVAAAVAIPGLARRLPTRTR